MNLQPPQASWAGFPCPVKDDDCEQRFLSIHAAGRHLERDHGEIGRWRAGKTTVKVKR